MKNISKLKNKDFIFSNFFKKCNLFESITYDNLTVNKKKKGVYSGNEWSQTRKINDYMHSSPSELNYRKYSYPQYKKIASAYALLHKYDFSKHKILGDLGGYPFFQFSVIRDFFPNLKGVLTDFDKVSIENIKNMKRFKNSKVSFFDIKSRKFEIFDDCDLLMMWAVDYALNDNDLIELFKYVVKNKIVLLVASNNVEKKSFINKRVIKNFIPNNLYNFIKKFIFQKKVLKSRVHGYLRTKNYFKNLCKISGAKFSDIYSDDTYSIIKIY